MKRKGIQIGKKEVQLSLSTGNMIFYIGNVEKKRNLQKAQKLM